jgi:hypothetical protein
MRSLVPIFLITFGVACTAKDSGTTTDTTTSTTSASSTTKTAISSIETPIPAEVNPPGDIPDTQAFIKYMNTSGGYEIEVPEGWARTEKGADVTFVNKFDGEKVRVARAATAPSVISVRANEVKQIESQGHAVTISDVSEAQLAAGKAIVVKYTSNSDPNPVTTTRIRLEDVTYIFFKNGKEAMLTVWAPQGADNADQWNRISQSLRWL